MLGFENLLISIYVANWRKFIFLCFSQAEPCAYCIANFASLYLSSWIFIVYFDKSRMYRGFHFGNSQTRAM